MIKITIHYKDWTQVIKANASTEEFSEIIDKVPKILGILDVNDRKFYINMEHVEAIMVEDE